MGAFHYRQPQRNRSYDILPPERRTGTRPFRPFEGQSDIADADFVVVDNVRSTSSRSFNESRGSFASGYRQAAPEVSSAAASCIRATEQWLQRASEKTFAALVAASFILVFGLAGGFSGLTGGGEDATLSDSSLHFTHVSVTPRDANGMRVLLINGIIENATDAELPLRPIKADLLSGGRLVASVVVAPPADVIKAGQSRGFSARVQHPGGKIPDARLSFMP